MKKVMLLLFLCLFASGFAQDCEKFKTGKFRVKMPDGKYVPDYEIIRKKKIQIEKAEGGYIKTKVKWIDDCTYQLIHIKSDILDLPKGTITTVKILSTKDDHYEAVGTSEGVDMKRFTMYKVD